jgi:large subunit ribosomal protein L24
MEKKPLLYKIRLNKGDTVVVRSGKYKGKTGRVLSLQQRENKVTVDGINVVKKHTKPSKKHPQGGIIEITKPIWVSKVAIQDLTTKRGSRIGYQFDKEGKKVRILKSSGKEIQ